MSCLTSPGGPGTSYVRWRLHVYSRRLGPPDLGVAFCTTSLWMADVPRSASFSSGLGGASTRAGHGCAPSSGGALLSRPRGRMPFRSGACGAPVNACQILGAHGRYWRTQELARLDVGVEGSSPFLHRQVIEFVGSVGAEVAIDLDHGKVLLRRLAANRVPAAIAWRPKSEPLSDWLIQRWLSCGYECRAYHSAHQEQPVPRAGGRHRRRGCLSGSGPTGHGSELVGLVDCRAGRARGLDGDNRAAIRSLIAGSGGYIPHAAFDWSQRWPPAHERPCVSASPHCNRRTMRRCHRCRCTPAQSPGSFQHPPKCMCTPRRLRRSGTD